MQEKSHKIIGRREVCERTSQSGTTIWRLERKGLFPVRVQISPNRVGWYSDEVDEWLETRPRVGV